MVQKINALENLYGYHSLNICVLFNYKFVLINSKIELKQLKNDVKT